MRLKYIISLMLLPVCHLLSAQNFYMQYSHDTLGNRTSRVRGILTREMEAEGVSADTVLQDIVHPSDTVLAFKDEKIPVESDSVKHGALIKTRAEKEAYLRKMMAQTSSMEPIRNPEEPSRSINDYDVGAIPLQYGMSQSGARTYSIPIATAPDIKYVPSLSLVYNSQGGYGYGGYGWDLGGLSAITLASKSLYYDGVIKAADAADTSAVFMLDGVRLVRNADSATSSSFPLVTATGHILAAPVRNAAGYVRYFNVRYPDGVSATYGSTTLNLNSQMISYPMTESVNLNGDKIEYAYSFDSTDGSCYLTSVRYGFDSAHNAAGVINLTLTASTYYNYYAGKKRHRSPMIDGITSSGDGDTLYSYGLEYTSSADTTLLTRVTLSNAESRQLQPLEFTYGSADPHTGPDSLKVTRSLWLTDYYEEPCIYRRGKFIHGSHNDGLLIYPSISNYVPTQNNGYCSGYDIDPYMNLYAAASISDITFVDSHFTVGTGFQTAEAVDVDGDGRDEIVRVNFGPASGSSTRYTISTYTFDSFGEVEPKGQFQVYLPGSVCKNGVYSPSRRAYYWGDFRGDGKAQLLAISYDVNLTKGTYGSVTASLVGNASIGSLEALASLKYKYDFDTKSDKTTLNLGLGIKSQFSYSDMDYNYHYGLKFTNTWTKGKSTTELYYYGNAFGNTSLSSIEENPLFIVKNKIDYLDFYTFIRKKYEKEENDNKKANNTTKP